MALYSRSYDSINDCKLAESSLADFFHSAPIKDLKLAAIFAIQTQIQID